MTNTLLLIYILLLTNFFGLTSLPYSILLITTFIFSIGAFKKNLLFKKNIILIFLLLFLNFISSYIYREQNFYESFTAFPHIWFLFLYFFLHNQKIGIEQIEKISISVSLIFCVCYAIQLIIFPTIIFNGAKTALRYYINGDIPRFRLEGQLFVFLGYFLSLNKYLMYNRQKYLLYMSIFMIIVFALGFRTFLLAIFISSIILCYRYDKCKKIISKIIPISILLIFILFTPFVQNRVAEMSERQKTETFSNQDYIRVTCYEYYTTEHFKNGIEYFLGSGYPNPNSSYGQEIKSLEERKFIYWVDLGLIGLSWMIGIPTVICILFYSFRIIFLKTPKKYLYCSSFFIFLIISSFTTGEMYRFGAFIPQAIVLYIFGKQKYEKGTLLN